MEESARENDVFKLVYPVIRHTEEEYSAIPANFHHVTDMDMLFDAIEKALKKINARADINCQLIRNCIPKGLRYVP